MKMDEEQGQGYRGPYCEVCLAKGFASPGWVLVVHEDGRREALCIRCHGDHEKRLEEAREAQEREAATGPRMIVCQPLSRQTAAPATDVEEGEKNAD